MKVIMRGIAITFAVAVLVLGSTQYAKASFKLSFDSDADGTPDLTVTDGDGSDEDADAGEIKVNDYSAGGWEISVTVSTSTSPGGSPPEISISSTSAENVSAGNDAMIILQVTDTDFVVPGSPVGLHAGLLLAALSGDVTAEYTSSIADSNAEFDTTEFSTSTLTLGVGFGSDETSAGPFSYTTSYSLTGSLKITADQDDLVNVTSGKTWTNPEPTTLAIWSVLFVGGGVLHRRRRKKRA